MVHQLHHFSLSVVFNFFDTYKGELPIGSHVIKNNLYVDYLLTGAATITELLTKNTEITNILDNTNI